MSFDLLHLVAVQLGQYVGILLLCYLFSVYPVCSCASCPCIQVLYHPPAHLPYVFTSIHALSLCIASGILMHVLWFSHYIGMFLSCESICEDLDGGTCMYIIIMYQLH